MSGEHLLKDFYVDEQHDMSPAESLVWPVIEDVILGRLTPREGVEAYTDLVTQYGVTSQATTTTGTAQ